MARTLTGVVKSDRGDKTIVITVHTRKTHPVYKKQYSETKSFIAHDENNEAKEGDNVTVSEVRPISKRKRFSLLKINERARVTHVESEPEATKREIEKPAEAKAKVEPKKASKKAKEEETK